MKSKSRYRNEIDGLRCFAVLIVIFYHYFPNIIPFGWLGVDIFFVISGYVISRKLLGNHQRTNAWGIGSFFLGRFKRLLPALVFCVVATSLIFAFLTGETGHNSMSDEIFVTGFLSFFGLANIYLFAISSGYFSPPAELNLFTHTWSLGIEEQFYLFLPILLIGSTWAARQMKKPVMTMVLFLLALLSIGSVLGYVLTYQGNPDAAFYLLPFRFWELGLGCLIGFSSIDFVARCRSFLVKVAAQYWLLPLIVLPVFFGMGNPQITLIVVVLSSALLLVVAEEIGWLKSALSIALPRYLGRISYSLYLWHWPLLVTAKWTFGLSALTIAPLLVLTLGGAIVSYHLVETPIRNGKMREILWRGYLAYFGLSFGAILCVVLCVTLIVKEANLSLPTFLDLSTPKTKNWNQHCEDQFVQGEVVYCGGTSFDPNTDARIFIAGDSHALHFQPMLMEATQGLPFTFAQVRRENLVGGSSGFPTAFISDSPPISPALDEILRRASPGDTVALAFHRGRLNPRINDHVYGTQIVPNKKSLNMVAQMEPILSQFAARNIHVILILDSPLFTLNIPVIGCAMNYRLSGSSHCRIERAQDEKTRAQQSYVFSQLAQKFDHIRIFDPLDHFYANQDYVEVLDENEQWVLVDQNHLSSLASRALGPAFRQFLLDRNDSIDP